MDVKSLMPWSRGKSVPSARFDEAASPFLALHREMDRLFDDFFQGFDMPLARQVRSGIWPQLDVSETDKEVKITAELPGLEEKDVELTLEDGVLTLSGEKKSSTEGPQYSERWHGSFKRSLSLGPDVDADKVSAEFNNGLLTVTVARKPEALRSARRIPIGH